MKKVLRFVSSKRMAMAICLWLVVSRTKRAIEMLYILVTPSVFITELKVTHRENSFTKIARKERSLLHFSFFSPTQPRSIAYHFSNCYSTLGTWTENYGSLMGTFTVVEYPFWFVHDRGKTAEIIFNDDGVLLFQMKKFV